MTGDMETLDDVEQQVDAAIDALDEMDESSTATVLAIVLLSLAHIFIRAAQENS